MPLDRQDDPDQQIPMPFAAAEAYARQVMAWSREPLHEGVVATRNVAYGPHRLHRYDVFGPRNTGAAHDEKFAKGAPVLVFWHGGGWTNGYRAYNHFMARNVVALGCILVTPSYRLVTEARFPAAFEDGLAALVHMSQHIAGQGGNPRQIFLAGHSAGGHLAALVALRTVDRLAAGVPVDAVQGCLPISGIMDLHHPNPPPGSLEARVYEMVLQRPEQDVSMSPVSWTTANRLPFVLTVGEHDSERVRRSNQALQGLLNATVARCALHDMPGQNHFEAHTSLADPAHPWYGHLQRQMVASHSPTS